MKEEIYTKYLGKTCPYCKTEFIEGDEIVICSDCEMPHHKECFIENKGCTTFGCQGSMKSLTITSVPVIDIELIEKGINKEVIINETNKISKEKQEKIYKEKINECIYDEIKNKLSLINDYSNNINDLITINKLIVELNKINDYKGSKELAKTANIKIKNISDYLLNTTKVQINCTDKISLVKIGLKRYDKIKSIVNVDVDEFKAEATNRISIIERENKLKKIEEERKRLKKEKILEKEKQERKILKRKYKKYFGIGIIILIIVIVCACFINKYFVTSKIYDEALNFMNEGKYTEAKIEFDKCGNFSKSSYYSDYCEKMLHYLKGKEYVEKQQYESAIKEFENAGDVEDVQEFINYCKEKLGI